MQTNTFIIKSEFFDTKKISKLLINRGNWKEIDIDINEDNNYSNKITFIYMDNRYRVTTFFKNINTTIKNIMGKGIFVINNKTKFHKLLESKYPEIHKKYMIPYFEINKNNYYNFNIKLLNENKYIMKPVFSCKGIGNKIITNQDEYYNYINGCINLYGESGWCMEEYIDNPLLYSGYKFHIRFLVLNFIFDNKSNGYMYKFGHITKSKDKYTNLDYNNPNIHDSHYIEGNQNIFPDDFTLMFGQEKTNQVTKQLDELNKYFLKLLSIHCYPDTECCFHIYGHDIIIDDNFNIKLLETNVAPGLLGFDHEDLFEGLFQCTVDSVIKPKNKPKPNNSWIQIL